MGRVLVRRDCQDGFPSVWRGRFEGGPKGLFEEAAAATARQPTAPSDEKKIAKKNFKKTQPLAHLACFKPKQHPTAGIQQI
jgi:hypothetical protein